MRLKSTPREACALLELCIAVHFLSVRDCLAGGMRQKAIAAASEMLLSFCCSSPGRSSVFLKTVVRQFHEVLHGWLVCKDSLRSSKGCWLMPIRPRRGRSKSAMMVMTTAISNGSIQAEKPVRSPLAPAP